MNNISAIGYSRNEEDIAPYTLSKFSEYNIPMFILDDSTDSTPEIIKAFNNTFLYKQKEIFGQAPFAEGFMQVLLEENRRMFPYNKMVIIFLLDEAHTTNPREIVAEMERESSSHCMMHSAQYFLHTSQKKDYDFDNKCWKDGKSDISHLKFCSTSYKEEKLFFDNGSNYDINQRFDMLPQGSRIKLHNNFPRYSHLPLRNPVQILARSKDRIERNFQPFYSHSYGKALEDCFRETFPGLSPEVTFNRDDFAL